MEQTWSTPASRRRLTLTSEPIRLKTDRAISLSASKTSGPGLKDGPPQGTGLGTRLIKAMAGSLDARPRYD
jgi:hypothetical protein